MWNLPIGKPCRYLGPPADPYQRPVRFIPHGQRLKRRSCGYAGVVNAGKSTLLNALLGEDKALVTPIAGTTRDTIEDIVVLDGIPFRFIDTAGVRHIADAAMHSQEYIEKLGVERS